MEELVTVENVSVSYWQNNVGVHSIKDLLTHRKNPFKPKQILKDINLDLLKGQSLGILGRNGCGKSTLLRTIAGVIKPQKGSVRVNGTVAPILAIGAGLELELTGYENISLLFALYGHKRSKEEYQRVQDFSGLTTEVLQSAVKTYSAGMVARLAFSISLANACDILIIDEVLAVGDKGFQEKCMAKIFEIKAQGKSIIFVSHFPDEVVKICNTAVLMEGGVIISRGETADICNQYKQLF